MFQYNTNNHNLENFKNENSFRFIKSDEYKDCIISYNVYEHKLEFTKGNIKSKPLKLTDSSEIKINKGSTENINQFELIESSKKYFPTVKTYLAEIINKIHDLKNGYSVKIGLYYKHFPFKLIIEPQKVLISNFLGYKSNLEVLYSDLTITNIDEKTYDIFGYDRINILNFVSRLERLKYHTKLSKLDPRKFIDCIYKKKE